MATRYERPEEWLPDLAKSMRRGVRDVQRPTGTERALTAETAERADENAGEAVLAADAAAAAALLAKTTADGRNRVFAAGVKPVAPADAPFVAGDLWYETDMLGRFVNVSVWSAVANDFVEHQMVASSVLVPGSVGNVLIANGAIDGKTITGATVRTAASGQRMQFDVNGLQAFRANGTQSAMLSPDTGGMRIDGTFIAGIAGTATGYRSYLSNAQLAIMDAESSGAIAGNPSSTISPGGLRLALGETAGAPIKVATASPSQVMLVEGTTGAGPIRSARVGFDGIEILSAADTGGVGQADAFLGTQQVGGVRSSYAAVDQVKTDRITSRTGPVAIEAGSGGDVSIQAATFKKVKLLSDVEFVGDTGWIPLASLGTGWSSSALDGYEKLSLRRRNNVVEIRGIAQKTSWTNLDVVGTLPVGWRPVSNLDGVCRHSNFAVAAVQILSSGQIRVAAAGTSFVVISGTWMLG